MLIHNEDRIILTEETSKNFIRNILHPDPDMICRRESYRPVLEKNRIEIRDDGCVFADIPGLDIPDEV